MGKLAFFPWLELCEPLSCADFDLLEYRRGEAPGNTPQEQEIIDGVLSPYHAAHGEPVRRATILKHRGQEGATATFDESYHADLFVFAELLAFSGLANRRFFGHFDYANRDHFRLILQEFADPGRGVLITTRRRDGSTNSFYTGSVFKVQRPNHVGHDRLKVDVLLLQALLSSMQHPGWPELYQAILLFNEANTDRLEVPYGTEVVLTYAAFEQALGMPGASTRDVTEVFSDRLVPSAPLSSDQWNVPRGNPRAVQLLERATSLRAAWFQDLANSRGSLAHGHSAEAYPACWAPHEHLLLAAHTLPLLVKRRLADVAGYDWTLNDRGAVEALELLINTRHFEAFEDEDGEQQHPWGTILDEQRMRVWARDVAARWDADGGEELPTE